VSAVTRQARANLRRGRLQAGLVVLVVAAAATLLTIAFATMGATGGAYERLFERTAGAHLWLELDGALVESEVARDTLLATPGVTDATSPRTTTRGADLRFDVGRATVHVREWPGDSERIARVAVVAGDAPDRSDEIAVDINVASTHDLELDDTLGLLTIDGWRDARVTAFTASAETCPYPTCQPTVVHLGAGGLAAYGLLDRPDLVSIALGLRVDGATSTSSVQDAAERALPPGAVVMAHDHETIRELTAFLLQIQSVFLLAFGLVATLAAGALIANAIGEAVRTQTRRIGLLKAVGFTRAQVARTYLVEQLGLAAVGAVAGLLIGMVVARATLREVAMQYGEASLQVPAWIVLTVPVVVLAVSAVFTILPVRRAARTDTITAIRSGSAARPRGRVGLAQAVPAAAATGLADLRARPARTLVATLTVCIAVVTLVFASTTTATLRWFSDDPAAGFRPAADLTVLRPPLLSDAQVRATFAEQPEVVGVAGDTWVPFRFPDGDDQLQIRFISDVEHLPYVLLEGRPFDGPGEVVAGYALARDHELVPGDSTTLVIDGDHVEVAVVGIYRESSNLGQLLMGDVATLTGLRDGVEPFQYHVTLDGGADATTVARRVREATEEALSPTVVAEAGLGILDTLPSIIAGLSLALAGIAVVGVSTTVWMGVQERRRDTGLLKAVGMSSAQTVGSILIGVVAVAAVAYLVGLPVGVIGTNVLLDVLARQLGFGPLSARFVAGELLLILPVIVAIAMGAAAVPARRAGRIPVAEALRYE
jgi:putative ABC transport system permease protein